MKRLIVILAGVLSCILLGCAAGFDADSDTESDPLSKILYAQPALSEDAYDEHSKLAELFDNITDNTFEDNMTVAFDVTEIADLPDADKNEENIIQESIAEESTTDKSVTDESIAKGNIKEESTAKENTAEENITKENKNESITTEINKSEESVQASSFSDDDTVWIPASGKKFHIKSDCSGMKNPSEVTRKQAELEGYTACKRCF